MSGWAIRNGGAGASVHKGNVGDPNDCRRVVGEVIEQHGRLDILVNNAGVTAYRPILSMTVDDWHKVLRVNLSGAWAQRDIGDADLTEHAVRASDDSGLEDAVVAVSAVSISG